MGAEFVEHAGRLVLEYQGVRTVIEHPVDQPVTFGIAEQCDVSVGLAHASRVHAHIECTETGFVLVDHSTNGTYVQSEDERVSYIHRQTVRLWGDGWLSLGEPCDSDSAVRYRHY